MREDNRYNKGVRVRAEDKYSKVVDVFPLVSEGRTVPSVYFN